jgi:hypothetical protein
MGKGVAFDRPDRFIHVGQKCEDDCTRRQRAAYELVM